MKERQIEAMYRARFDERRRAREALDQLFNEVAAGRGQNGKAWLIAVAHPRIPNVGGRRSQDEARAIMTSAASLALRFADRRGVHPIENVDRLNPRHGLRRWVFVNSATEQYERWKESWASIHHDGSVTLATKIGGRRVRGDSYLRDWELTADQIECAVADFMALLRATAPTAGASEYDVRVGVKWTGRTGRESLII